MRLPNQIRAVACAGWVSILGLGIYFSSSAGPCRSGVIRVRAAVAGTQTAVQGAQDAPTRPRTGEPHTGGKPAAKVGSPGFASESPKVVSWASNQVSPLLGPSVARSQGVRSVPLPVSRQPVSLLKEAGRGSYSQAFEGGAAWKGHASSEDAIISQRLTPVSGWINSPGLSPRVSREIAGIKPGRHLRTLATYQPYILTAYSAGCILPKFGPEPPPQPMASGEWPVAGLHVAADPSLAFGTVLEVVYRGLPSRLIVGDRGRAIRGRRLDLFLADCRAARAWGRRTAYVREIGASE